MPEQPDLDAYIAALRPLILNRTLTTFELLNPFVLRSVEPPPEALGGCAVVSLRRIGKRIAVSFDADLFVVIHLMIAGRLLWRGPADKAPGRIALCALQFETGRLILTEAGTRRRASVHIESGENALARHDPGGAEVTAIRLEEFARRLHLRNRTLKRALTDPHVFAGIGNAYSDEILHAARLSPVLLTDRLDDDQVSRLFQACRTTLCDWTTRLTARFTKKFPGPGDVTAFREDFTVHGRFGLPCPACGKPVQRIRYAENETNYCAECQNNGIVLADRSLSRLLKDDWPRNIDEWSSA
ncbi:MAG: hypothetical protein JNG88_11375 [Phycisphaerales bacterium]|nr:hypothetical protein [Phycisphaerales bacterium]